MENDKIIKARELRKVVEQVFGFDLLTKNRKKKKYLSCKKMFGREMPIEYLYTKEELIEELLKTKEELSLLHLKYEELINYKHKQEMEEQKWGSIYKLIRERTPIDMEDVVERRINAMFNTSYEY